MLSKYVDIQERILIRNSFIQIKSHPCLKDGSLYKNTFFI